MTDKPTNPMDICAYGLTKRELISCQILAALCVPAIAGGHNINEDHEIRHKVNMAMRLTNALLKALEEQ